LQKIAPILVFNGGEEKTRPSRQKAAKRINMALFGKNQNGYGGMIIEESD